MVATLKVDKIQRVNADSDMISLHDTGVDFAHTPTIGGVGMFSGTFSGQVLQIAGSQDVTTASHLSVTSTSPTDLALTCKIKPRSANSILLVQFFSNMMYGAANAIELTLHYRVDPTGGTSFGSYTTIIGSVDGSYNTGTQEAMTGDNTFNGSTSLNPYYGWTYNGSGWGSFVHPYWWDHNQTAGSNIEFKLQYKNTGATSTNYLVHANGQNYGWIIYEIGELP